MTKPRVYIETTVICYLTAMLSRDLLVAAHQQITSAWWYGHRDEFECHISELVIQEVGAGDPKSAARRRDAIQGIPSLSLSEDALRLAKALVAQRAVPTDASEDALHIALAATNGMDYLVTWNCRHIANARMRMAIEDVCRDIGYEAPIICTPEELCEE